MLTRKKTPTTGRTEYRVCSLDFRTVEDDERTIELSVSSEQPVDRWFGQEILSHDKDAIDLKRLTDVGSVLFSHGRDPLYGRMPIAKILSAAVDEAKRQLRAQLQFDTDERSEVVLQKIKAGMLRGVSIGYAVSSWEEVKAGKKSANGRFIGPAYVATRWEPYEISIEPTPADASVGVGRTIPDKGDEEMPERKENTEVTPVASTEQTPTQSTDGERTQTPPGKQLANTDAAVNAERQRVTEITSLCRDFDVDPVEHIESGASVDAVRKVILEQLRNQHPPRTAGVVVTSDETDKFRTAAADSILLRGGVQLEKPADGATDLRGMRLRDLAVDCLQRTGTSNAHRLADDQLFREVLTPDSQFAGILSSAVRKSMSTAYQTLPTTFEAWTGRGSNPDFKATTHYRISEAGELRKVTQAGEIQFDELEDQGVSKAIATFARGWGFTRQALINDDLGMLVNVPQAYVRAAKRGINKLVYKMLGDNPAIYDGKTLFHDDHENLGTGAAIGTASLGEGRKMMRLQKNLRGKEVLNITPAFLIVPAALEVAAQQFFTSTADPNGAHAGVANIFRNAFSLVVDPELDGYDEKAWYLAASPSVADTIEVTYLNGDSEPKLDTQVGFDYLGIRWRIYIDYGVTVLDYRGLLKNPGAQA